MYHLTLLWLCITAAAFVAAYAIGRRHGKTAERLTWNRDYDIVRKRGKEVQ